MNEANWDRIARTIVGVALLILAATVLDGAWVVVAGAVGAILAITGTVGWCPIYATLRRGTRKKAEGLQVT